MIQDQLSFPGSKGPEMKISSEFPQRENITYLNHAAVSPWPKRTFETVKAFADENMLQGAADYPQWLKVEMELRGRFQRLLHAESPDDIALVKNTSEGLSLVAYGLDWKAGDNIVLTDQEFPSNRIVWESLERLGVQVRKAVLDADDSPEKAITSLCDEQTRLVSISSVQFGTGLRLDLNKLGVFCEREGILFCIDAIQSLGALQLDVQDVRADFVVADGHKWMLGPEGLAVFYSRPRVRRLLRLHQYGWHMVKHAGDFDRLKWEEATSGRRFEPGSPNMLGIHALNASLSLLEDVGMAQVETAVLDNAVWLMRLIGQEPNLKLITPSAGGRFAGIVTFRHQKVDQQALYRKLMDCGVICAARGGGIRFSPHFYNTREQLERAVDMAGA
ncbi:MAG: aminotransferase class V-fold PLP-dependent enzyme [Mariprofundaceae bacterium]